MPPLRERTATHQRDVARRQLMWFRPRSWGLAPGRLWTYFVVHYL